MSSFLKTAVKVAKAMERANHRATKDHERRRKQAERQMKVSNRNLAREQKIVARQVKLDEAESQRVREELKEKYRTIQVRLKLEAFSGYLAC